MKINFFPTCRMNAATGYGLVELGLMKALIDGGHEVGVVDTQTRPKFSDQPTIVTGSPEWGEYVPGRLWALTMSESTRVSEVWVDSFNRMFERVFVPAPFLVDVYKESGITIPVHFIPLGVDYQPPEWRQRLNPIGMKISRLVDDLPHHFYEEFDAPFNWLTYSLGDTRKGAELAMLAFNRLFGGDERHHLFIKCRDNPQWLTGLEDPQVTMVRGEISQDDWYNLLGKCHAFIFPSRGEGFGYPPRQAVLSGLPTVATAAHGTWDVNQWGYPIPVKEMRQAQFSFVDANAKAGQWWEPNAKVIDMVMQAIVDDYPAALQIAQRGREYLLSNFTWAKTVEAMVGWL